MLALWFQRIIIWTTSFLFYHLANLSCHWQWFRNGFFHPLVQHRYRCFKCVLSGICNHALLYAQNPQRKYHWRLKKRKHLIMVNDNKLAIYLLLQEIFSHLCHRKRHKSFLYDVSYKNIWQFCWPVCGIDFWIIIIVLIFLLYQSLDTFYKFSRCNLYNQTLLLFNRSF